MNKIRNISKYLSLYLCTALATVLLSGCGDSSGSDAVREISDVVSGSAISGSAVSGGAVSGGAVSGPAISESVVSDNKTSDFDRKYPDFVGDVETICHTENYGYRYEYEGKIIQVSLDDFKKTEIICDKPAYYMGVLAVRDGYLYCITEDYKENSSVEQIPIKKDAAGKETLLTKQAKELINAKKDDCFVDLETVYVGERYLICPKEGSGGKLLKLDLKTGEKTTFSGPETGGLDRFVNCGDYLVMILDSECVYACHVEKGKWTKVCSDGFFHEELQIGSDAWNPEGYYYTGESKEFLGSVVPAVEVHRYDFQKQKSSLWISEEQIQEAVREVKRSEFDPDALDVCAVLGLYAQSDRVYVEVQSNWKKGGEYYVTYQVLSRGAKEKELRYEKALTDCMKQHGTIRRGSFVDDDYEYGYYGGSKQKNVVMEGTKLYAMIDGKAYMICYDGGEKKEKRGAYTLATGEFFWITNENMDALKWHSFYYEPDNLFFDVDDEPTDTVARWGGRIEEDGMRRVMDVGDMGCTFKEDRG